MTMKSWSLQTRILVKELVRCWGVYAMAKERTKVSYQLGQAETWARVSGAALGRAYMAALKIQGEGY